MGAFYLHPNDTAVNTERMLATMRRRGFAAPRTVDLGAATLYHWRKQVADEDNAVTGPGGSALFAVGTPIYRGMNFRGSLQRLLDDLNDSRFNPTELRGTYCLIHKATDGTVRLLVDPNGLYFVFLDRASGVISSSQLAVFAGTTKPYPVNRLALLEQLLTGLTLGPDTLAEGVEMYTPAIHRALPVGPVAFLNPREGLPDGRDETRCRGSFDDCAREQLAQLHRYMADLRALAGDTGVDIGLSGGYDSRLLFALAQGLEPVRPHIHSHWTDSTHEVNVAAARALAELRDLDITVERTVKPIDMEPDDLLATLDAAVLYYDGRNNNNMGFYSTTYTAEYRRITLGGRTLGLSGLNGEVFRNYNHVHRPRTDVLHYLYLHYFYPGISHAFDRSPLLSRLTERILEKIAAILGVTVPRMADSRTLRRHLGEVRAPFYAGPVINANLGLSHYLAPFAEYATSVHAYRAHRQIRSYGGFEGRMITLDSPEVAAVPSHYGHRFDQVPLKARLKEARWLALGHRGMMLRRDYQRKLKPGADDHLATMLGKSERFGAMVERFQELFPEAKFTEIFWYHQALANAIFTGHVLDEYADGLSL